MFRNGAVHFKKNLSLTELKFFLISFDKYSIFYLIMTPTGYLLTDIIIVTMQATTSYYRKITF